MSPTRPPLAAMLLGLTTALFPVEPAAAPAPVGGAVSFAIHGNPFRGFYDPARGFRRAPDNVTVKELLAPWRRAVKSTGTFPGLDEKGQPVRVRLTAVQEPVYEDIGAMTLTTDRDALFWSSPALEVHGVPLVPAKLEDSDRDLLVREAIARGVEWRKIKGTEGELNPNPPVILDPRSPGNVRVTALEVAGSPLVLARCEFFERSDAGRSALQDGLLLVYSRAERSIKGSLPAWWGPLSLIRVAGDRRVYLLFTSSECYECDGTTIMPVASLGGEAPAEDRVLVEPQTAIMVWSY
jgi:hypothetical protein